MPNAYDDTMNDQLGQQLGGSDDEAFAQAQRNRQYEQGLIPSTAKPTTNAPPPSTHTNYDDAPAPASPPASPHVSTTLPVPAPNVLPTNAVAPLPPGQATPATTAPFQREQFRDAWMHGSVPHTPEGLAQFLKPYGLTADKAGRVHLPTGETIDMLIGAGAGGLGYGWTGVAGQGAKTGQTQGAGGGGTGTGGGGTGGAGGGAGGTGAPFTTGYGGQNDAINQAIMRLLARGENPLSPNDPTLQAQFLPTRNVMERGAQLTRGSAAERMAAEGTNIAGGGGPLSGEVNSINENLSGQEGQLMASLVTSELQGRRQDVVNALQAAQGSQRMALQQQLAALDRELERQRMAQQNNQFYDDFGLRLDQSLYDRSRPPTPAPV